MARLAGLAVFDPAGDQIGRIRDVVVSLRGPLLPRVHGFVVEVQPRRRVFLPITRITSIEARAVIFTGKLNMRRFECRDAETLAIGEMLDRTVEYKGERVTVQDLAMEQPRPSDWLITKVAVRRGKRRRGETLIVDWDEVSGFAGIQKDQGAANLLAVFEALRPADLANMLHELPSKRMAEVAAAHGVTPAQVVLRWHLQHDIVVIPKSATPSRIDENLNLYGFALTEGEMSTLDGLSAAG